MNASRARPWLISSAATAAVLVAVELGFRILGVPVSRPEDLLTELDSHVLVRNRAGVSYRMFQGNVPVTTDRWGFRNGEVSPAKPEGVYRIVAFGDSTTFGYGVGDDETWCAQLEKMLNAAPGAARPRYEVVNAAVIGSVSTMGLRLLDRVMPRFRPDCIVVSYALNDAQMAGSLGYYLGKRLSEARGPRPAVVWLRNALWNHSVVSRWILRDVTYEFRKPSYGRYWQKAMAGGWKQVSPDEYRGNLAEFARIARAIGSDVIFLPMPVRLKHTLYTVYRDDATRMSRAAWRRALRDTEKAIAKADKREDRSAMYLFVGRIHETLGELRPALDAYLAAMELSDQTRDLRWEAYRYANLMGEAAAKEKVPLANVLPAFYMRELTDCPEALYADGYHPGPLGHRIIAEALQGIIADLVRERKGI